MEPSAASLLPVGGRGLSPEEPFGAACPALRSCRLGWPWGRRCSGRGSARMCGAPSSLSRAVHSWRRLAECGRRWWGQIGGGEHQGWWAGRVGSSRRRCGRSLQPGVVEPTWCCAGQDGRLQLRARRPIAVGTELLCWPEEARGAVAEARG